MLILSTMYLVLLHSTLNFAACFCGYSVLSVQAGLQGYRSAAQYPYSRKIKFIPNIARSRSVCSNDFSHLLTNTWQDRAVVSRKAGPGFEYSHLLVVVPMSSIRSRRSPQVPESGVGASKSGDLSRASSRNTASKSHRSAGSKVSDSEKTVRREKKQNLAKSAEHFKIGLAKVKKASNRAQYAEALTSFTLAIELRPSNARYYFARANCYRSMGDTEKAYMDYSSAVKLDDSVALYHANRALVLRKMGRVAEAYEDYNRALLIDPSNGGFFFNRAITLYEMGRFNEAVVDYTKAISEKKNIFRSYYNRGNCYRRMGLLEKSIADLQKGVNLEPRNSAAHNNLGLSFFEDGQHEQAIQCFTDAIALDSAKPSYYNNRGLALYHHGDLEAALADMNEAVAKDSAKRPDPNFYFNRGNTRLGRHEPLKALADFAEALRIAPMQVKYVHSTGLARQQMEGEEKSALAEFEKALNMDPSYVPARYHCGLMHHRLGRLEEAVRTFGEVIKQVDDDRLVFESRGLVFQDMGKHHAAVRDFTRAIELDTHVGENYYHRGESLLRLGQLNEAMHEFALAFQAGFDQPCLYNGRGMTRRKLGDLDGSIADLNIAVARSSNPEFYLNRSTCYLDVNDPGSAERDMSLAIAIAPRDFRLLQQRGVARYAQHKFDQAILDFTHALEIGADDPAMVAEVDRYLGYAYANSNRNELAVSCFRRAIEYGYEMEEKLHNQHQSHDLGKVNSAIKDAEFSEADDASTLLLEEIGEQLTNDLHERAKALQMCGRASESIRDFDKVIDRCPRNAHAYFRRGFANKSIGNFERAAEDFERAKALDPTNPSLAINYRNIGDVECIILCDAGREPHFS